MLRLTTVPVRTPRPETAVTLSAVEKPGLQDILVQLAVGYLLVFAQESGSTPPSRGSLNA